MKTNKIKPEAQRRKAYYARKDELRRMGFSREFITQQLLVERVDEKLKQLGVKFSLDDITRHVQQELLREPYVVA